MRVVRQSWQDAIMDFQFQRFSDFKPGWVNGQGAIQVLSSSVVNIKIEVFATSGDQHMNVTITTITLKPSPTIPPTPPMYGPLLGHNKSIVQFFGNCEDYTDNDTAIKPIWQTMKNLFYLNSIARRTKGCAPLPFRDVKKCCMSSSRRFTNSSLSWLPLSTGVHMFM